MDSFPPYPHFDGALEAFLRSRNPLLQAYDRQFDEESEQLKEKYCLQLPSLQETIKFAVENKDTGSSSVLRDVNDWTDNYGFDEFVDDFYGLRNKNLKYKRYHIESYTQYLNKYITHYKSSLMPQQIFEEVSDISGSYADIARYIENVPECMIDFDKQTKRSHINIVYQCSANAHQSRFLDHIGIMTYCLQLLLRDRSVNLYAAMNNKDKLYILFPIYKTSDIKISSQIGLVLLNTRAFFRRIGFALFESFPNPVRRELGITLEGDYGRNLIINESMIKKNFTITPDILLTEEFFHGTGTIEETCKRIIEEMVNVINS